MNQSFPKELTALPQWICWRLEPDPNGGKDRKVPYDPKSCKKASTTAQTSWASLAETMNASKKYNYSGIGFVFTRQDSIIGVDIDHCIKDGKLNDVAKEIVSRFPSYTEISPSGAGLHIFYLGEMPGRGNKNSKYGVEMYAQSRYFTMTGKRVEGTPDSISDGADALPWIHENYIAKKHASKKKRRSVKHSVVLSDEQVLEKANAADNGDDFKALWAGEWETRYGSQSEADLALCCALAFWTGKDKEQMDRLFRASKLFRTKWDTVHHASGATYGEETVAQAIQRTERTYSPGGDMGIFESHGRYFREKGDNVYPLTNFVVKPVEMLIADEEAQMTCDLVTVNGETFHQIFMTSDFGNLQRFKGMLNKRTISLSYTGAESDLEVLKGYLAELSWDKKYGVKVLGLHRHNDQWVFVATDKAFAKNQEAVSDIVQLEKSRGIETTMASADIITADELQSVAPGLLAYNEPAKTVSVLAWCAGCYVKEHLRVQGIKFPHLFLIGEAGSGKSTTMERIILPIFGQSKVVAAPQVTAFTLMKESASSNLFPQALDEFKPSKMGKTKIEALYNHFRDSYDGHAGIRGRADLSQICYLLMAPVVVAGEESPDEPAIRERGLELLFSKKDLGNPKASAALARLSGQSTLLTKLGRGFLEVSLSLSSAVFRHWYEDALKLFRTSLPSRVANNLACAYVGLRVVERFCQRYDLQWENVFSMTLDACAKHLEYAVCEYLLDGGDSNKSVVEQTLEIMDRMGLHEDQCRMMEDGKIALHFRSFYDEYTGYRQKHAILGECLPYAQFMKQLRKSDLYIETVAMRFTDGVKKVAVLDYALLQKRCDIEGFLRPQTDPL